MLKNNRGKKTDIKRERGGAKEKEAHMNTNEAAPMGLFVYSLHFYFMKCLASKRLITKVLIKYPFLPDVNKINMIFEL